MKHLYYLFIQVLQHDLNDPEEREIMRDDSRKWALLFLAIGGGTAIGFILQASIVRPSYTRQFNVNTIKT